MDGLSIRQGNTLIDTGKTVSEMKSAATAVGPADAPGKTFADTLKDAVGTVNQIQKTADTKMQQLATGKTSDIPEVMMAVEKADIAMRLMVQVRNKIIEAYQDIMKMQV